MPPGRRYFPIEQGLGRSSSGRAWLELPDVLDHIAGFGAGAILLPAALFMPLLLPIRRPRHWWLPVAVLLGSWTLGSTAVAVLGHLKIGGEGVAFADPTR